MAVIVYPAAFTALWALAGLLIVAFVPWLALFLPHYFGFRG